MPFTKSRPSSWDFYPLLRTLGLQLLPRITVLRREAGNKAERPKPIIQSSLSVALAQSSIHVLPILTLAVVISLNLGHLFLGRTIPRPFLDNTIMIAMFQVLAKLQELLIVSSLTSIVFSAIRHQLISGSGVPLEFLCAGFTFSQPSYFWSPEFWGTPRSQIPRCTKIFIVALLVLAGLIAATAGLSVAVLLVPRL